MVKKVANIGKHPNSLKNLEKGRKNSPKFEKGSRRAKEAGQKGGQVFREKMAEKRKMQTIQEAMADLLYGKVDNAKLEEVEKIVGVDGTEANLFGLMMLNIIKDFMSPTTKTTEKLAIFKEFADRAEPIDKDINLNLYNTADGIKDIRRKLEADIRETNNEINEN